MAGRLQRLLAEVNEVYPAAWAAFARCRNGRGMGLPDWPEWCWCPLSAAFAIATDGAELDAIPPYNLVDVPLLGALGPWREGKGIYRFDATLYEALVDTEFVDTVPTQVFYQLPEWCLYVALPEGERALGFFVFLESDITNGRPELRLLFELVGGGWQSVPFYLDRRSVGEALADMVATAWANTTVGPGQDVHLAGDLPDPPPAAVQQMGAVGAASMPLADIVSALREMVGLALPLVLYLCSAGADIAHPDRPDARPRRAAHGPGERLPFQPRQWEVGYRIGTALRAAQSRSEPAGGTHASPRAHIRRAHWHSYWTGPKTEPGLRQLVVIWQHPVLVGASDADDLVPVVRTVVGNGPRKT